MTQQNSAFETLIDDLCHKGFAACENFLPAEIIKSLAAISTARYENGEMHGAKIGKKNKISNLDIRGDAIDWLDKNDPDTYIQTYFSKMHALKQTINQNLFMNLHTLETHMAIYPVGGIYKKHLDQFTNVENTRQLSSILYLNENWKTNDGGQLRLYLNEYEHLDILPTAGKLVLFLSEKFWHEVLPAKQTRISLTGWFHTRRTLLL